MPDNSFTERCGQFLLRHRSWISLWRPIRMSNQPFGVAVLDDFFSPLGRGFLTGAIKNINDIPGRLL